MQKSSRHLWELYMKLRYMAVFHTLGLKHRKVIWHSHSESHLALKGCVSVVVDKNLLQEHHGNSVFGKRQ